MAHPYPTPTYGGGVYPGQAYYSPFQPGLQPPGQTPPGLPQQVPQPLPGYQPPTAVNAARFDANAQIRPAAPFPFPPTTFTPDMFKQFSGTTLPPPPPPHMPPVPLPNLAFPQFPPVTTATTTPTTTTTASPHPQNNAPGFAFDVRTDQRGRTDFRPSFAAATPGSGQVGDRGEEAVLRERDANGSFPSQTISADEPAQSADSAKAVFDRSPANPKPKTASDLNPPFSATSGPPQPPTATELLLGDVFPRQSNGLVVSGDGNSPPYQPSLAFPPPPAEQPTSKIPRLSTAKSKDFGIVERTYHGKSASELRQLAKGALLSLAPHHIHYADLLKEGIDARVLQQLYGELGIPVPSATDASPTSSQALSQPPHLTEKTSSVTVAPGATPASGPSPLVSTAKDTSVPGSSLDGKGSSTNADKATVLGPSPGLERKDRIAQLLAAKTGRPSPTHAVPASAPPVIPTKPSLRPGGPESHGALGPTPLSQADFAPPNQGPPVSELTSASAKSKTQTEVVRQKMEQLRREAQGKAESHAPVTTKSPLTEEARTNDTITQQEKLSSTAGTSDAKEPHANDITQFGLASMIPGLFMTSAEGQDVQSSAAAAIHDEAIPAEANRDAALENATAYRAAGAETESRRLDTTQTSGIRPSSSHLSPKRPLASDSFVSDSEPQTKRPYLSPSTREPEPMEYDIPERDDASEGEIVEETEDELMESIPKSPGRSSSTEDRAMLDISGAERNDAQSPPLDSQETSPLQIASTHDTAGADLYKAKQSEIEAMRKRIVEMEQRKQLRKSMSQAQSPAPSSSGIPSTGKDAQLMGGSPAPSVNAQGGVGGTGLESRSVAARAISKLTPEQLAERAAALKADLLKQRAQRQKILQAGLPDLNAEVQKTESRLEKAQADLAQVRQDVERRRAELARLVKLEEEMIDDVAHLETQLQEGRSGQKQYSDELHALKAEKLSANSAATGDQTAASASQTRSHSTGVSDSSLELAQPAAAAKLHDGIKAISPDEQSMAPSPESTSGPMTNSANEDNAIESPNSRLVSNAQTPSVSGSDVPFHQGVEQTDVGAHLIRSRERYDDEMGTLSVSGNEIDLDEKLATATPDEHPLDQTQHHSEESPMDIDESDGSASMSDSGSDDDDDEEEYEPADAETIQPEQTGDDESDEYDPEETALPNNDHNVEAYDLAENVDMTAAPPFPEAEQEQSPEGPFTSTEKTGAKIDDADLGLHVLPQGQSLSTSPDTPRQDDQGNGLPLTNANTLTQPQDVPDVAEAVAAEVAPLPDGLAAPAKHFVPYQTPLRSFKSFRFHPEFNDVVKNGYRSLTYSNNIDPRRPLCPTELSGETCSDTTCHEQHFRQLGLTDDKILVQMSSANDIKDKALRDQYVTGLKQVIADLRQKGVKEFENVANALSAYRRQFHADQGASS